MEQLDQDFADEILVKAVCMLALSRFELANALRQCSISIGTTPIGTMPDDCPDWYITLTIPKDAFDHIFFGTYRARKAFEYLAFTEVANLVDFNVVDSPKSIQTVPKADLDQTKVLRSQQQDFIERLNQSPPSLLRCATVGRHSESIIISTESTKHLRDFCWEMSGKFRGSQPKEIFISTMKGKLGEEALVNLLGDYVTGVDYELKLGGDGKVDFKLTSAPDVGIQVKARNGSADNISWWIDLEEIESNSVLVCFLIQEEVTEAQSEYHLVSAGFIPTANIDKSQLTDFQGKKKAALKMSELLYMGGLKSYLEFLEEKKSSESKPEAGNLSSTSFDSDQVWEKVVECLKPPGTQMLMRQCARLLSFNGKEAKIGFCNPPLFPIALEKVPNIEAAFLETCEHKVMVSLEVVAPLPKPPT
ncbi:MAG: hypothetical protein HY785_29425 [Oscillatoriophycideae cyanobacterium NC_groundwater_1537_Pr4_S-0.65um_50_18]|nr:hypothetical protein [Oscillatoriophycideae cyanobacterium NC_groundwater_1537_Pr4_S-0.65um_50_18]